MKYAELLDSLLKLIEGYGTVHRRSIQPFTKNKINLQFPDYSIGFDDEAIRESLIEHVGSLPIIASYLHPYMDHEIDLGRSLIMIAIHDIGELIVGDQSIFNNSRNHTKEEHEAATHLLHHEHHPFYEELKALKTNEAKFAQSIDKLAPDIYDYLCGEQYLIKRMTFELGWTPEHVIDNIRKVKRPHMEWSPFLTKFHDELFSRFTTHS